MNRFVMSIRCSDGVCVCVFFFAKKNILPVRILITSARAARRSSEVRDVRGDAAPTSGSPPLSERESEMLLVQKLATVLNVFWKLPNRVLGERSPHQYAIRRSHGSASNVYLKLPAKDVGQL